MSAKHRLLPLAFLAAALPAELGKAEDAFAIVRSIDADDGHLQWVEFSADGRHVAACGDRFVQMFDVQSGRLVRGFRGNKMDIKRLSFSPDGELVASAGSDHTVHVWKVESGEVVSVLRGHTDKIIGVSFSADGRYLVSAARQPEDGTVRVWKRDGWTECAQAAPPRPNTNSMYAAFSPDGRLVAASGYRGAVRLFEFDGQSLQLRFQRRHAGGEMTPHVAFAPDGKSMVTSGWDKTLRCWDVKTGDERWRARAPEYARCFEAAVFSPNGKLIYCVTRDETVQARDARTGELRHSARWNDQVRGIDVSPDGTRLATTGHSGKIKLWKIAPAAQGK